MRLNDGILTFVSFWKTGQKVKMKWNETNKILLLNYFSLQKYMGFQWTRWKGEKDVLED